MRVRDHLSLNRCISSLCNSPHCLLFCRLLTLISFYRIVTDKMEITRTLVILEGLQRFTSEQATDTSQWYLPDRSFDSHLSIVAALSCTFGTSEFELHQSVLQKFNESDFDIQTTVANWLHTRGVTRHQYARSIKGANSKVDGLFVWLAVQCE